ncbi:MAG: hypothetical protein RBT22_08085 [Aliarcobacter sp.]|jgi:hypothetical protein|nr:hypothetical protein [Aliarcobacter sp.]
MNIQLLSPTEIAKAIGEKKSTDLIGDIDNISISSLIGLKKTNPNKYEIVILGLITKKLNINIDDLIFLSERKNNSEKSLL